MRDHSQEFEDYCIERMRAAIRLSTGCTEPVAIALNAATARKNVRGSLVSMKVTLDMGLFKNASGVVIPGTGQRSIKLCAALGFAAGDPGDALNVLGGLTPADIEAGRALCDRVEVEVREDVDTLYIETAALTDQDSVRVITYCNHDQIERIEHPPFAPFHFDADGTDERLKALTLGELIRFAETVPLERLAFLREGVRVNRAISEKGMDIGFGHGLERLSSGMFGDSILTRVQRATGAASYARMTGIPMPVMIATGSGNQGITVFLTVDTVAEYLHIQEDRRLRALALAHMVNLCAKAYIGTLAPICSCGVASGLGAAVGICWLLGGGERCMLGCMRNTLGGIAGMICDGAKEGCANKVALAATSAVLSAFLSADGVEISEQDGILSGDMPSMFQNLRYLLSHGMASTNRAILDIILQKD